MLTDIFIRIPVEWRTKKILVLNVDEMLGTSDCIHVSCMHAHINQYIFPTNKILLTKAKGYII